MSHRVTDPSNPNCLNGTFFDTRSEKSKKLDLQWQVPQKRRQFVPAPLVSVSPSADVVIEIEVYRPMLVGYDWFGRPIYQ